MNIWPFRRPPHPEEDERIRRAAAGIAAQERQLAELKLKRESLEREISHALDEITRRPKERH